ncbi:MAG: hypothetical protein MJK15_00850 [Colwellia sp.]|nr:hypothetical protein [Colwellia sp.]
MPHPINTFVPDFEFAQDRSKRNTGGLSNTGTLIEQGDNPVNVVDIERHDKMDIEMRSEYPEIYEGDSDYMQPKRCGGDIDEGVSMCRPMYSDMIRKNSDY